jgi:lipopolysaccharide/colanic/teichoic acid biosynthesis glycosyltransferase
MKRALDIVLAGCGLIASAPLWAAIAAAIKVEDRGPVFFTQDRVGLGGRRFRALKFRSLSARHALESALLPAGRSRSRAICSVRACQRRLPHSFRSLPVYRS